MRDDSMISLEPNDFLPIEILIITSITLIAYSAVFRKIDDWKEEMFMESEEIEFKRVSKREEKIAKGLKVLAVLGLVGVAYKERDKIIDASNKAIDEIACLIEGIIKKRD